ncbi:MAG: hypothetical protein M5U26_16670 [Planctomycetota bacterium]|nr:hypothetical protein [Planctomycetota bacterium]
MNRATQPTTVSRRKPWYRIGLGTLLLQVFLVGILMHLNFSPREIWIPSPGQAEYQVSRGLIFGWPSVCAYRYASQTQLSIGILPILANAASAIVVLVLAYLANEYRGQSRKRYAWLPWHLLVALGLLMAVGFAWQATRTQSFRVVMEWWHTPYSTFPDSWAENKLREKGWDSWLFIDEDLHQVLVRSESYRIARIDLQKSLADETDVFLLRRVPFDPMRIGFPEQGLSMSVWSPP